MLRRALSVIAVACAAGCTPAAGDDTVAPTTTSAPTTTTTTSRPVPEVPAVLTTDRPRQSQGVVAAGGADAVYNYGPTLMVDGGRHRMWWCSQLGAAGPAGDDILLAESTVPGGPYAGPDGSPGTPVFSGSGTGFDGVHTCDPSVIKVDGTYYLYYTGAPSNHAPGQGNAVGLATSRDGRTWARANGGAPILTPAMDTLRDNHYGLGQPAAVHVDGWFYLMVTDTTGRAAGWNGAGQFVLRAKDAAFTVAVESLTEDGFKPDKAKRTRARSVADAFSADLMWIDALAAFAIAHETADGTTLTFWDADFRAQPTRPLVIPGPWQEGPGLVRDAEGHAPRSLDDPCERVPVDLVRATRDKAAPTDLRHFGADITGTGACADPARAAAALVGFAVPSPQRTVDLVVPGGLVRVERRAVAEKLALRVLDRRIPALDALPIRVRLDAQAQAVKADSRMGFVLNGKLWRISDPAVPALNASPIAEIPTTRFDGYVRGQDLEPV